MSDYVSLIRLFLPEWTVRCGHRVFAAADDTGLKVLEDASCRISATNFGLAVENLGLSAHVSDSGFGGLARWVPV